MKRQVTEGKCMYCFENFSKNTIGNHLLSCKARKGYFTELLEKDDNSHANNIKKYTDANTFLLKISSPSQPEYWLFIELSDNCTLSNLDSFILSRAILWGSINQNHISMVSFKLYDRY